MRLFKPLCLLARQSSLAAAKKSQLCFPYQNQIDHSRQGSFIL
jgi:hypothetical protein